MMIDRTSEPAVSDADDAEKGRRDELAESIADVLAPLE
jgi:hypothetical protein